MAKREINPEILEWALVDARVSPESLAEATKRPLDVVTGWLRGSRHPNGGDVTAMAKLVGRSPQFFSRPVPPQTTNAIVNRRASLDGADEATREESIALRSVLRRQRISRLALANAQRHAVSLPKIGTQSPQAYAETMRIWLDWSPTLQVEATSKSAAFKLLRLHVEATGVMVFLAKLGEASSRGFSLPDSHAPSIVVNESVQLASVRSYTLLHELAHLGRGDASLHHERDRQAERWCEEFAAAFLMPAPHLHEYLSKGVVSKLDPGEIRRVKLISDRYKASWQSVAIRLDELGLSNDELKANLANNVEPNLKGFNRDGGRRTSQIRLEEFGTEFTRLILESVDRHSMTNLDARKLLRVDAKQLTELSLLVGAVD